MAWGGFYQSLMDCQTTAVPAAESVKWLGTATALDQAWRVTDIYAQQLPATTLLLYGFGFDPGVHLLLRGSLALPSQSHRLWRPVRSTGAGPGGFSAAGNRPNHCRTWRPVVVVLDSC